ncbi:hypothetical protein WDW37_09255 [Bdellovibrionota bacterium FG-1]
MRFVPPLGTWSHGFSTYVRRGRQSLYDLKGNWLWQRLPENEALELTKAAMDLSVAFADMDVEPTTTAVESTNSEKVRP